MIKAKSNYYIHNVCAGTNDLHVEFNKESKTISYFLNNNQFYGERSKYERLSKISTEDPNIYLNLGGNLIKLVNKNTNCDILFTHIEHHDIILVNTNDFDVVCNIEYSNVVSNNIQDKYIGYVGDKQIIHDSGMIGILQNKKSH